MGNGKPANPNPENKGRCWSTPLGQNSLIKSQGAEFLFLHLTMTPSTPVTQGQPIDRVSHSPSPTVNNFTNGSTNDSSVENKSASIDKPAFAPDHALEKPAVSPYSGSGTQEDPYVVGWLPDEKEDPYNWTSVRVSCVIIVVSFYLIDLFLCSPVPQMADHCSHRHLNSLHRLRLVSVLWCSWTTACSLRG